MRRMRRMGKWVRRIFRRTKRTRGDEKPQKSILKQRKSHHDAGHVTLEHDVQLLARAGDYVESRA